MIETVGFNNSNLVIEFENDDDSLTIENAKGQDIQIANNTESVVAQINDNELHFDGVANFYWATGDDATISVDFGIDASSDGVVVCLDGSSEDSKYRGNVKTIDASSYIGYASLVGNDLDNVIVANNSGNTLWGGSGTSNDTLFGGNGDDVFRYGKGNGKDVITSVDRGDVIDLFDINLSDLVATGNEMFSGNNLEIQLDSENTLTVKDAKNSGVTLKFADGTSLRAVNKNLSYLQEQN